MMMREEGVVVGGLLMGLNALDYNVLLKGEEFDRSVSRAVTVTACSFFFLEKKHAAFLLQLCIS